MRAYGTFGRVLIPAVAGAWWAASAAAGPFVTDNIGPNPDTLMAFDTATPGTATLVTTLAGNFIRGLDMDTPTTGYYVATSNIGTSPIGFYRLNADGSSTLIGPLPTATGECGLTLDRGNTRLYYSQAVSGDDILYEVSLSGTFSMVGPIAITGVTGSSLLGLATDPNTGTLYGVDTTSDSLVTINPATGAGTVVGSLGVAAAAIGGLDFDNQSGELFLAADPSPTKLYRVDKTTGAATLIGSFTFGTSSIASVSVAQAACPADFNHVGGVTVQDIFDFLAAYFAGLPTADFNGVGGVTVQDIFDFLGAYFTGCP
jgi:hypothetical protein